DQLKLKIPMKIGDTVLKVTMARFSRTLATLVAAGVDIIKALEITGQTAGNWVVENALANVRARVHEGVPIAQPEESKGCEGGRAGFCGSRFVLLGGGVVGVRRRGGGAGEIRDGGGGRAGGLRDRAGGADFWVAGGGAGEKVFAG